MHEMTRLRRLRLSKNTFLRNLLNEKILNEYVSLLSQSEQLSAIKNDVIISPCSKVLSNIGRLLALITSNIFV